MQLDFNRVSLSGQVSRQVLNLLINFHIGQPRLWAADSPPLWAFSSVDSSLIECFKCLHSNWQVCDSNHWMKRISLYVGILQHRHDYPGPIRTASSLIACGDWAFLRYLDFAYDTKNDVCRLIPPRSMHSILPASLCDVVSLQVADAGDAAAWAWGLRSLSHNWGECLLQENRQRNAIGSWVII